MYSRERVRRAMRHETPNRVPVMCQLAPGHYFLHSPRTSAEIWFDSNAFVEQQAKAQFGDQVFFKGNLDTVHDVSGCEPSGSSAQAG